MQFGSLRTRMKIETVKQLRLWSYGKRWLTNSTSESGKAINYCIELVREYDFENYLCTLRLPQDSRISGFAVRAFNIEVAKAVDTSSENRIVAVKLQFWKDVLNEIYKGSPVAHPVAVLLSKVICLKVMKKIWFHRLIHAREKFLSDQPFLSINDIEEHGERSVSPVLYLILASTGSQSLHADHVVSHIGRAASLTTVLRTIPYHALRRKVLLPRDLMNQSKLTQEHVLQQKNSPLISNVVYDIASHALAHVKKARVLRQNLSSEELAVCLPAVACADYLERLQTANFDVFHPSLQRRNWMLPLNILKSSLLKTF